MTISFLCQVYLYRSIYLNYFCNNKYTFSTDVAVIGHEKHKRLIHHARYAFSISNISSNRCRFFTILTRARRIEITISLYVWQLNYLECWSNKGRNQPCCFALLSFVLFTCTHKKRERESHVHAHINVNVDHDCDDDEISLHSFCQEITQQIISNFRSFLLCIIVFTSTVTFRMLKILLFTHAYVACTH